MVADDETRIRWCEQGIVSMSNDIDKLKKLYESISTKKENANSGYPLLADGCVAMDERRYLSIVSDMTQYWSAEFPSEKLAMKWMAIKIYNEFIVAEKKATVS